MKESVIAMWCLIGLAGMAGSAGLVALVFRPSRLRLPRPRPGRLMRGCVALIFLLVALTLGLIALLFASQA